MKKKFKKIYMNYLYGYVLKKDYLLRKFLSFLIKDGKQYKSYLILKNLFVYIKYYLNIQPYQFIKVTLFIHKPLFKIVIIKRRYRKLYIPRALSYKKAINYMFLMLFKFIKKIKNKIYKKKEFLLALFNIIYYFFFTKRWYKYIKKLNKYAYKKRYMFKKKKKFFLFLKKKKLFYLKNYNL